MAPTSTTAYQIQGGNYVIAVKGPNWAFMTFSWMKERFFVDYKEHHFVFLGSATQLRHLLHRIDEEVKVCGGRFERLLL